MSSQPRFFSFSILTSVILSNSAFVTVSPNNSLFCVEFIIFLIQRHFVSIFFLKFPIDDISSHNMFGKYSLLFCLIFTNFFSNIYCRTCYEIFFIYLLYSDSRILYFLEFYNQFYSRKSQRIDSLFCHIIIISFSIGIIMNGLQIGLN